MLRRRNWVRFFRRYETHCNTEIGYILDFLVDRFRGYMREAMGRAFVGLEVGAIWEWAGLRFDSELEGEGGGRPDKGVVERR